MFMPETLRLAELRAKTDRQLFELIAHRLDAGLSLARDGRIDDAERAYVESRRLLPLVRNMEKAVNLEGKLWNLRCLLYQLPAGCARAACF